MTQFSCDMCMDLMPLVKDGVASQDSRQAVLEHLKDCPACKELFEGEISSDAGEKSVLERVGRQLRTFCAMVMMFGIFYGMMLTAGSGLFYNVIIMPVIGGIGYYLFRWRGLYLIPGLLLVTHLVTNALGLGEEVLDLPTLLIWTGIYCCVAMVGFVIAALLHFAFRKERD